MTNLRIRSTVRPGEPGVPENAGEWYADKGITEYHRRMLKDYQTEEPENGWHFESRGSQTCWHRVED